MTRSALARQINYSIDAIKKVENGQRVPSESMARLLAEALGIAPELHSVFVRFGRTNVSHPAFSHMVSREEQAVGPNASAGANSAAGNAKSRGVRLTYSASIKPIIGRKRELETIRNLLLEARARLLTIHGAPGVGKTRLAQEIVNELRQPLGGEIYFVPLAEVTSPRSVLFQIANHMSLSPSYIRRSSTVEDILILITEQLRARRVMLVLDNCEHVLTAAPLFQQLLEEIAELTIVVTSREPLALVGENCLRLGPLSYPESSGAVMAPEAALAYEAVQMFAQEARALDASFEVNESNCADVVAICSLLNGLPLCIELAAAQLAVRSLTQLHTEMQGASSSQILQRTQVEGESDSHHLSLRQAIEWSYQQLNAAEQQVLESLSVFATHADEEAILAVAFGDAQESADSTHKTLLPYLLHSLADKNLIQRHMPTGKLPLYGQMTPIRNVLREEIICSNRLGEYQQRYMDFFCRVTDTNGPAHVTGFQAHHSERLSQIDQQYANIIAALEWSLSHDFGAALKLVSQLEAYWRSRGLWHDARYWLDQVVQSSLGNSAELSHGIRAHVLSALASFQLLQGESVTAIDTAHKSLALAESEKNNPEMIRALIVLGDINCSLDDYSRAYSQYDRALVMAREASDRWHEAKLLSRLGHLAHNRGDLSGADRLLNQSLLLWHAQSHQSGVAGVLQRLAQVELMRGRAERANDYARQSLNLYSKQGNLVGVATALQRVGATELQMGHLDRAEQALRESTSQLRVLELGLTLAEALTSWGRLMQLLDRPQEAIQSYLEAIHLAETLRSRRMVSSNLCALASVLFSQHKHIEAAKLLAVAVHSLQGLGGVVLTSMQRQVDILKMDLLRHLSQASFNGAWEEGTRLTLKQALDLAN